MNERETEIMAVRWRVFQFHLLIEPREIRIVIDDLLNIINCYDFLSFTDLDTEISSLI